MSVRTMARVWAESRHSGTHLLMLLAIADFADDDGRAYPAVGTLAVKCRMTARNVNLILSALRASGELDVRGGQGPRGTNLYRVVFGEGLKAASGVKKSSGVKPASPTPEAGFLPPCSRLPETPEAGFRQTINEPSMNHQEPKSARARRARTPDVTLHCPSDVDQQVWSDWLALRKAKRAPVTQTTIEGAEAEAKRAGMTLETFLRIWCRRGSQGLEADWIKPYERRPHAQSAEPAWRTEQRERNEAFLGPAAAKRRTVPQPEIIDAEPSRLLG